MERWEKLTALFILCVFGSFMAGAIRALWVKSECLSLGYPNGQLDMQMNAYCVARINQTDVVLPLEVAKLRRPPLP